MRKLPLTTIGLLAASPLFGRKSYADWVNYSQTLMSITVLALIVLIGGLALRWTYKNSYKGKLSFWKYGLKNPLVQLGCFIVFVVLVVNICVPKRDLKTDHEAAALAKQRQMPHLAEFAYRNLSRKYPYIIDYHYQYIIAYYQQEQWTSENGEVDIDLEDLRPVDAYYRLIADSNSAFLQDIGHLGVGMIGYYRHSDRMALSELYLVKSVEMPYRNLFLGRVYLGRQQLDSASYFFRKEYALGVVPEMAVAELALMTYQFEHDSTDKILAMINDPVIGQHVPLIYQRFVYTKQARLLDYLSSVMADWWMNIQWIGLLGAILGTIVWLVFLRRVDEIGQIAWLPMLVVFAGGALFSFVALILYDFLRWEWEFFLSANGSIGHDFLYCVLGIGVIEELVKIIPFLLLLQFTKRVNSPLSYLIYASVSALGFAFVENVLYFDAGHVGIMHGRVLVCNVFHMFATSTIAFGMMLGRFKYRNLQWPFFFLFFALAALAHGFYDFWLINEQVSLLVIMAYVLFIHATFQYATYLNNALNQMTVPNSQKRLDPRSIAIFLTVGLMGILLFEYFGLSIVYGSTIGNYALVKSMGMGGFLMFFVVMNLSNIDIVPGEWFWLRLWNFGTRQSHHNTIGQRLQLVSKSADGSLASVLPLEGKVISRISLFGNRNYFLFQLDQPPTVGGRRLDYVLLLAKKDGEQLAPNEDVEVNVIVFKDKEALERKEKRKQDFGLLDTVVIA